MTQPVPDTRSVRLIQDGAAGAVIEVTVAAPIATVWDHLRDRELLARWHGWDAPGNEAEIDMIYHQYSRESGDQYSLEMMGGPEPGSYELGDRFDLRSDEGGAVVRITRSPKGGGGDWDAMYDDITQGWISFLAQLKFAVEQQLGKTRRTIFLHSGPGQPRRARAGVIDVQPGERYAVELSSRLPLNGTGWMRTDAQTGLTVDDYGPGLVVLADMASAKGTSVESSMAIITTYGLSDRDFAKVEKAWTKWWNQK